MNRLVVFAFVLTCSSAFAFSTHLPTETSALKPKPDACKQSPNVMSAGDVHKMGGDLPFPLGDCADPMKPEPHIDGIKVPQVKESWQLRWIDDQRAEALIWKEGRWLDRASLEIQGQRLVGSSRRMESFEIDLNAGFLHACFKNQNGPCAVLSIRTKEM